MRDPLVAASRQISASGSTNRARPAAPVSGWQRKKVMVVGMIADHGGHGPMPERTISSAGKANGRWHAPRDLLSRVAPTGPSPERDQPSQL